MNKTACLLALILVFNLTLAWVENYDSFQEIRLSKEVLRDHLVHHFPLEEGWCADEAEVGFAHNQQEKGGEIAIKGLLSPDGEEFVVTGDMIYQPENAGIVFTKAHLVASQGAADAGRMAVQGNSLNEDFRQELPSIPLYLWDSKPKRFGEQPLALISVEIAEKELVFKFEKQPRI